MLKSKTLNKLHHKIHRCNTDIANGEKVELRTLQKENYEKRVIEVKHQMSLITMWEKSNGKWFDGTDADVYTYNDLEDHCNELCYSETPLDLIKNGDFTPIGGSAITPYDLREYIYLPSSLIEEDENYHMLRKAFEDYAPIE